MFIPFFLSLVFTDKCNILHEAEVYYQMAVYELYEYGNVLVVNYYCVFSFLSVSVFYRQVQYLALG